MKVIRSHTHHAGGRDHAISPKWVKAVWVRLSGALEGQLCSWNYPWFFSFYDLAMGGRANQYREMVMKFNFS